MKKTIVAIALLIAALAVFATGVAMAQTPQPAGPINGLGSRGSGDGPLHTYMVNAMAQALGITPADFETRRAAGQTAYQIALERGIAADQIPALLANARTQALNAAVAANVITQQQADWMNSRPAGMGAGPCNGTGQPAGMGRGGRWQQANP